ncbi:MAG: nitroreductase/quinone reductase family protein [Acidimicrobiales bacterium]
MDETAADRGATNGATYRKPGFLTRRLLNPLILACLRMGVSVWGARVLESKGRQSGLPRRTPVNLLTWEGGQYLVSPRGQTQWVRNVRAAAGRLTLLVGRRRDERTATEVFGDDRIPVLRAYLAKWKMEIGVFFDGVSGDSDDAALRRIADDHPVFALSAARR